VKVDRPDWYKSSAPFLLCKLNTLKHTQSVEYVARSSGMAGPTDFVSDSVEELFEKRAAEEAADSSAEQARYASRPHQKLSSKPRTDLSAV